MRIATLALALCTVLPATIAAGASEGVPPIHKHRVLMHHAAHAPLDPAATALAPAYAIIPAAPALKSDDGVDGLSRDSDKCNMGCIDH